jgi:phosphatidate cytidylyltransferase
MLRERVLAAVVLIPIVVLAGWLGGWWFTAFVAFFATVAAWELFTMMGRNDFHTPILWLGLILVALLILESGIQPPNSDRFQALLVISILVGLTAALFLDRPHASTDFLITLGGAVYLGITLRYLALMRALDQGLWLLILTALTVWMMDSGAYFIGKSFGKHKLWPRISPKKTWEGLFGGLFVGTLSAIILTLWLIPGALWWQGAIIGVLAGIVGPLGDLSESLFKRQVGAKDSSHLIPGHGGFFDRIDSFIFVGPVVYLVVHLWWGW